MKPTLSKKIENDVKRYIISLDKEEKLDRQRIIALYSLLVESRKTLLHCEDVTMIEDETIVSKKFEQIKAAETVEDVQQIMEVPKIEFINAEYAPANKWILPEEELLMWSKASLEAKPNFPGYARYRKLFLELFPTK